VSTSTDASTAKLPLRSAMEARDLAAALDAFAPDAVVRSPFTDALTFDGREQIAAILTVILDAFAELSYSDEVRAGDRAVLVARARVAGRELEFVDYMRLDEAGKIREFTVFFRPLPASTAAMRVIGAGLGRRKSAARAALISALARPLALMTAAGDGLGVRLVRRALQ
jgi:ketosteroid isomerase-like protein